MSRSGLLIDFAMFLLTVTFAAWMEWSAKDLIWGLWIASLTMGFSFILASALSMFVRDKIPRSESSSRVKKDKNSLENTPPLAFHLIIVLFTVFLAGFGNSLTWLVLLVSVLFLAGSLLLQGDNTSLLVNIVWRLVTYAPMAAFLIGFFSIHFGGFHFVHGLFLNQFFPLVTESPFGKGFEDTFLNVASR